MQPTPVAAQTSPAAAEKPNKKKKAATAAVAVEQQPQAVKQTAVSAPVEVPVAVVV